MATTGVTTALPATMTLRDATAALDALRQAFAADTGNPWRVDAAPVQQLDTSALAVLLECARMAAAGQRRLEIVNTPQRLTELAHLYGVDGLLGIAAASFEPAANVGESRAPEIPVVPILR